MKGKTASGFEFEVEDDSLDDYDIVADINSISEGRPEKVVNVLPALLGDEQLEKLKEHYRNDKGKVKFSDMVTALTEIINALGENNKTKNS